MTGEFRSLEDAQHRLTAFSYLVIPDFFADSETTEMLNRARQLLDAFDIEGHPLVYHTLLYILHLDHAD